MLLVPCASQCLRGIWAMPSIVGPNFGLALKEVWQLDLMIFVGSLTETLDSALKQLRSVFTCFTDD